jgi:endonuclease G
MRKLLFSLILLFTLSSCKVRAPRRPLMGFREATEEEKATMRGFLTENGKQPSNSQEFISDSLIVVSPAGMQEQILKRTAYFLSYNKDTKTPNWVAWILTANHTKGKNKRDGLRFQEDFDVPTPRATNMDYMQSGYDRGHMCPSADNKWSKKAQEESFLYTNCCPQDHVLNAGSWNDLENACRLWARRYGKLWIACGPLYYGEKHKRIGRNKVVVPEAFYKVVLANNKGNYMALGFIFSNSPVSDDFFNYTKTVDEVERITGYDFFAFLPDSIENIH